jgi:serine/threonine protein phosphatase PrpC
MRHLRRRSYAVTDIGKRREGNEDAFVADDTLGLYVVCDGVGGQAKGEVASSESAEQVRNFIRASRSALDAHLSTGAEETLFALRRLLESAVQSATYIVYGMGEQDPEGRGMSTTLSALLLAGEHAVFGQVGDSRIYRLRDGMAEQMTEDHTLAQHKIKLGLVTPEEARTMKGRNTITRAVGHRDYVEVDTFHVPLEAGDRFLLCSDGLHGYLRPGEVESLLSEPRIEDAARRGIEMANERGGKDNITAVVVALA